MKPNKRWLMLILALALVATACSQGGDGATTTTAEILTDVGVDLEAGVIKVGMLSDLTGPFGPLVSTIVEGHRVFWEDVNRNGGIGEEGLQVELVIRDTTYSGDLHTQFFEELKDQVVAFGHSTGSPQTVGILDGLEAVPMLAIPLTWYSGWSDPKFNETLVHHGAPYCIEAMNLLGYLADQFEADNGRKPTLSIATVPGDYGLDGAAGAKLAAAALGLEVLLDLSGQVIPPPTDDPSPLGEQLAAAGADINWLTVSPGAMSAMYLAGTAGGYEAIWAGSAPNWNPGFIAPGSEIAAGLERDWYFALYLEPWSGTSPGITRVRDLMAELSPDSPAFDYYGEGFVEATILEQALRKAYANGDMTRAGVLAAAKSLDDVDFDGLAPNENFVGEPNDIVQRAVWLLRPDPADLVAGGSGSRIIEANYTHPIAANFQFDGACFSLER